MALETTSSTAGNWPHPRRCDPSVQLGYLLAIAGCALAVPIRWSLEPVLGNTSQFIIFYFAVAPAAIIGGLRPGLVATLFSTLCGILLFTLSAGHPWSWLHDPSFLTRLLLFVLSGVMICMIAQRALNGWRLAQDRLAQVRAIFDNAGIGIVEAGKGGRFTAVNERACGILGYSREELLQLTVHDLTWPDDRQQSERINTEIVNGVRDRISYEKRYRHRNGSPLWVHVTVSAVRDHAGFWLRSVGTFEDISRSKQTEHSLRRRSRSLRLLSEVATRLLSEDRPEAALGRIFKDLSDHLSLDFYFNYLVDEDGATRLNACAGVNDAACLRLRQAPLGEHLSRIVIQRGERMIVEHMSQNADPQLALLQELGMRTCVCHPLISRRRVIGTLSFGSRTRDWLSPEELALLQAISNQIAVAFERTRLVDELHQRAQELTTANAGVEQALRVAHEASAAKDHFLAVLSHELRTPLTPVVTTAGLLLQDPDLPPRCRDDLAMIRRNVELEARLIDDLLDVTRITRGKLEMNRQVVPLVEIIRQAADVCAADLDARGLRFQLDTDGAPHWISADPARLQQVFWNLLKNAIKFTPPGGRIAVRCRQNLDARQVAVEVSDTGKGIEAALLPHIFRPFEQGGVHVTRQFGGLGLGLTITKGLVELHGGAIAARSDGPGQGACFTITLPLADPPEPAPHRPGTAGDHPDCRLRILLVEDHGDTAKIMKRVLLAEGHRVQTACDVASAVKAVDAGDFDLLLSDLGLPDGSGLDVVRCLRSHGRTTPAIALSGYGQEEDIRRSKAAGFNEHLIKPVDINRLKQAICHFGQEAR